MLGDRATPTSESAEERIARLEGELAAERARAADLAVERDRLREAYQAVKLELELLKRRIFVAKAERIDTAQLELELGQKLATLDDLAHRIAGDRGTGKGSGSTDKKRPKPTGRRWPCRVRSGTSRHPPARRRASPRRSGSSLRIKASRPPRPARRVSRR